MLNNKISLVSSRRKRQFGFSLVELLVTLAVFLVISGAAFSLVRKHMPMFVTQQNQAALNFGLRNAAALLQIDAANGGSGFYQNADVTSWPISITIVPGSADDVNCHNTTTNTYGPQCFDEIDIIKADPKTPPAQIADIGNTQSVANDASLWVVPVAPTTLEQLAASYKAGDQILIISAQPGETNGNVATVTLDQAGAVDGAKVKLHHNKTAVDGTNSTSATLSNDKYHISSYLPDDSTTDKVDNKIGPGFEAGDWVVRLAPSVFKVDASDPTNPKLAKLSPNDPNCLPDAATPFKPQCIIAEQIIGFKVGAQLYDSEHFKSITTTTDCNPYCYNPATYKHLWSQIRGVRITLIGRTAPSNVPTYGPPGNSVKKNSFDHGPYDIDAISVVVSPRSVSMRDEL